MKRQCECAAQADEIVFGPLHECTQDPSMTSPTRKKSWVDHANFNERPYEATLSDGDGDLG